MGYSRLFLPLCAFGIMCLCNKKQVKIIWQIVGILAAGIVLGVLGDFGLEKASIFLRC